MSCLKRLHSSNREEIFNLSCRYRNPTNWYLWRAVVWQFQKLPTRSHPSPEEVSRILMSLTKLSRQIADGVVTLASGPLQPISSLREGFSSDFSLVPDSSVPANSKIVELFTGKLNPRSYHFLPANWPYPIQKFVLDKGTAPY